MELLQETNVFTNDKKEEVEYKRYYVIVCGIKIYLTTSDKTAKQLLDNSYGK